MKLFYFHDLFNAVKALQYRYGKGDIINIHRFFDGKIILTAKRTSCKPHTVSASYDGKTLRIYRHQMKVTIK